ncbi:hypothetical protein HBH70_045570 [Parastagonospora nodorum]|nr:hypothetical protein HBH53_177960 [Parastagonospora nodorum]KAH3959199.1 hypothetical protein HBH51_200320 [Parastagonospora nodorum]KAH3984797.1 hypothetical protein HBH52_051580 [Parastagonospora nodorum]KAH4038971.1 hypothetical protein HBI09_042160 [Parastagonospora nodorum]KAH4054747.1 hypothetical protein HBH49_066700 [Parastagonospora nodorum]
MRRDSSCFCEWSCACGMNRGLVRRVSDRGLVTVYIQLPVPCSLYLADFKHQHCDFSRYDLERFLWLL